MNHFFVTTCHAQNQVESFFNDVALIHLSIKNQSPKKLGAAWTLRGTLLVCKPGLSFQHNVREVFVCEECQ